MNWHNWSNFPNGLFTLSSRVLIDTKPHQTYTELVELGEIANFSGNSEVLF
jgi:hypothetical protein